MCVYLYYAHSIKNELSYKKNIAYAAATRFPETSSPGLPSPTSSKTRVQEPRVQETRVKSGELEFRKTESQKTKFAKPEFQKPESGSRMTKLLENFARKTESSGKADICSNWVHVNFVQKSPIKDVHYRMLL